MVDNISEIRDRLRETQLTLSSSRQNFFSSDVAENNIQNIIAIVLSGDGTSRTIEIEKQEEDDSYTMKYDNIHLSPAQDKTLPLGGIIGLDQPLMTLEGTTNLTASASGGSPEATALHWDEIIQ